MSSSSNTNNNPSPPALQNRYGYGQYPNTTFVQADPSNFRAVVQRLTGAAQDPPSAQRLPVTAPPRFSAAAVVKPNSGEMGPRRPAFKLHERRQAARKLEISLNHHHGGGGGGFQVLLSPSAAAAAACRLLPQSPVVMASPVSPLEMRTPRTPKSPVEELEERAIAEKRFYLHPSPVSNTPRTSRSEPPELLPLFPLHSPRDHHNSSSSP